MTMTKPSNTRTTTEVIRARKTDKLFGDPAARRHTAKHWTDAHRATLKEIIETGGHAPFHKKINQEFHQDSALDSPAPWRFYVVDGANINRLLKHLSTQAQAHPNSEWSRGWNSKIKNMLAACGALVQVTWLPEPGFELSMQNIEHVAAASAATQNILLAAEEQGWISYWSSGGILRSEDLLSYLNIPSKQLLLGSLFLTPEEMVSASTVSGKMRGQRGEASTWSAWLDLPA